MQPICIGGRRKVASRPNREGAALVPQPTRRPPDAMPRLRRVPRNVCSVEGASGRRARRFALRSHFSLVSILTRRLFMHRRRVVRGAIRTRGPRERGQGRTGRLRARFLLLRRDDRRTRILQSGHRGLRIVQKFWHVTLSGIILIIFFLIRTYVRNEKRYLMKRTFYYHDSHQLQLVKQDIA